MAHFPPPLIFFPTDPQLDLPLFSESHVLLPLPGPGISPGMGERALRAASTSLAIGLQLGSLSIMPVTSHSSST
eukprot:CAMPEP_0114144560 /NCGR_PEP_ID=MMETSP0043_2-20121206/19588_1 /TAXON_ID=464988 /ORGANISM="Hemiselmis andersenii, Strain CCMP644" /LENGTH=73 /DNA_ID=CAMNT_0001238939 /DNA_START=269 /DNA_END=487 /DNA_ORIENTATION=+